jgi:hypothetical protein
MRTSNFAFPGAAPFSSQKGARSNVTAPITHSKHPRSQRVAQAGLRLCAFGLHGLQSVAQVPLHGMPVRTSYSCEVRV